MNRENQKAFFASLVKRGFAIKHEPTTNEEYRQAQNDGIPFDEIHSHDNHIDISQAMVLKELKSGKKSAVAVIDNTTGTNEDDRFHNDLRTKIPFVELEKMGKIKLENGEWKLA